VWELVLVLGLAEVCFLPRADVEAAMEQAELAGLGIPFQHRGRETAVAFESRLPGSLGRIVFAIHGEINVRRHPHSQSSNRVVTSVVIQTKRRGDPSAPVP